MGTNSNNTYLLMKRVDELLKLINKINQID